MSAAARTGPVEPPRFVSPAHRHVEVLHDGEHSFVTRCIRRADNAPVVLKWIKGDRGRGDRLAAYRHEFELASRLNVPGVVHAAQIVQVDDRFAIEFDDIGAVSLRSFPGLCPMAPERALAVVRDAAAALADLHAQRVVHCDVNPANIIRTFDGSRTQLIDLGIAVDLGATGLTATKTLSGTPAYLAPEQTGRLDRPIDTRTDLYALGVVFFELLAGRVPFAQPDLLDLVHAHIALSPPTLASLGIAVPVGVQAVIARLMAKSPAARYQTAEGLLHDLDRLIRHPNDAIVLGANDFPREPNWSVALSGRESERKEVVDALDALDDSGPRALWIGGYSGIGKSALSGELRGVVAARRGVWCVGKNEQFTRLSGLDEALRGLVRVALAQGDVEVRAFIDALVGAAGSAVSTLTAVIPELAPHLHAKLETDSEESDAPDGQAARRRLAAAISALIAASRPPDGPLVICVDDLQWADRESLLLLELLVADAALGRVLFVGAFRDNEVGPGHPLAGLLERSAQRAPAPTTLTLGPLSEADSAALVADVLRTAPEESRELAGKVYALAGGNPFFTLQVLRELFETGALRPEVTARRWRVDWNAVEALSVRENVVDLLVGRLDRLPPATRAVLSLGAAAGARFHVELLARALQAAPTDVFGRLSPAVARGLIVADSPRARAELAEVSPDGEWKVSFRFVHDRVQQAAAGADEPTRQTRHLALARTLRADMRDGVDGDALATAEQYALAAALVTDADERLEVRALLLRAAHVTAASTSYSRADELLTAARSLLDDACWVEDRATTLALHVRGAEVAMLSGQFASADALISTAHQRASGVDERVAIGEIQLDQYLLQGRFAEGVAVMVARLADLGWAVPTDADACRAELVEHHDRIGRLTSRHGMSLEAYDGNPCSPRDASAVRLAYGGFLAAYLSAHADAAFLCLTLMARISLERGFSPLSGYGLVGYGMVLTLVERRYEAGAQMAQMGVTLARRTGEPWTGCKALFLYAADVQTWTRPRSECFGVYEQAWKWGVEAGDWLTVGYVIMQSGSDHLGTGSDLREFVETYRAHLEFLLRTSNVDAWELAQAGSWHAARELSGGADGPHAGRAFDPAAFAQRYADNPFYLAWLYSSQIRVAWHLRREQDYDTWIGRLAVLETTIPSHANKLPICTLCAGLMAIERRVTPGLDPAEVQRYDAFVERARARLREWAEANPNDVAPLCALLDAAADDQPGASAVTSERYADAIAMASRAGLRHVECIGWELLAEAESRAGRNATAAAFVREAHRAATAWGAVAVARRIEHAWPEVELITREPTGASTLVTPSTTMRMESGYVLDAATISRAVEAIASEIELERLVERLLSTVRVHAGAQRVTLVSCVDGGPSTVTASQVADETRYHEGVTLESPSADALIPVQVVRYVLRVGKLVFEPDATLASAWRDDPYLLGGGVKSLIVCPLVSARTVRGALVIEHFETTHAFTHEHQVVIHHLSSQIAAALTNARLYSDLEAHRTQLEAQVKARTAALEAAIAELNAAQDEVVRRGRLASLGSMVAGVAHELNTPIGVVSTALSVIDREIDRYIAGHDLDRESTVQLGRVRKAQEIAVQNLRRAGNLVRAFKNVAAPLGAHQLTLSNLGDLVDRTVASLEPRIDELKVEVRVVRSPGDLHVECDPTRIAQVVTNLIENAGVHAYDGQGGPVTVHIHAAAETVELRVVDEGAGMSARDAERCFDPFFTTARRKGGTGLGLSIVYASVVDELGGAVEVNTAPGLGTTFVLRIPRRSRLTPIALES